MQKCNLLKGTSNYISEDFSGETLALCKDLWQKEVKTLREEGEIAYLNYKTITWRERESEREREREREREKEKIRYKMNIDVLS